MKKKLLFLVAAALLGICSVNAQNPQPYTTRYGKPLNDAIHDSVYYRQFNGNPDSTTFYNINKRTNIVYNADQLEISELEQAGDWGSGTGEWANSFQYTFTYDANKRWIGKTTLIWNGSGWDNHLNYIITYNSNNQETSSTYQSWVEATSSWYSSEKDTIIYDAAGNITATIRLGWDSQTNNFGYVNKSEYTYSGNLKVFSLYSTYNGNNWTPVVRFSYSYTGTNNHFTLAEYWTGQTWLQTDKFSYEFNEANQVIKETLRSQKSSVWSRTSVTTYNYNSNGILKKRTHKEWSMSGSNNFSGVQQQYYLRQQYSGGLVAGNAGASEAFNDELAVYPNPSKGVFNVKLANNQSIKNMEVFNAVGEKVLEQRAAEVDMNAVAKGIYFIKVYDGVNVYQQKLVIE